MSLNDENYDSRLDPFAEEEENSNEQLKKQHLNENEEYGLSSDSFDKNFSSLKITNDKDYDPSLDPFTEECINKSSLTSQTDCDNLSKMKHSSIDCAENCLLSSQLSSSSNSFIEHESFKQYSLRDGNLEKEGLLCPDCLTQFKTITELMNHFESQHKSQKKHHSISKQMDESSSLISLQMGDQIRGFINKLVNKPFLSKTNCDPINDLTSTKYQVNENPPLCLNTTTQWKNLMNQGPKRSHYEEYRVNRDRHIERYLFETNKLLISLDKLLRNYPALTDIAKRKKHEQSIVEWIDESIVPLCPSCANKFSILQRKHHCRLCGAVMCSKCSQFISFEFAYKLINPVCLDQPTSLSGLSFLHKMSKISTNNDSIISNSPLKSLVKSINSPLADQENIDKLRVCFNCKSLLTIRKEKIDMVHIKAPFLEIYNDLRGLIDEINRLLPIYYQMTNSINIGESTYQLEDAFELKQKLTQTGEKVDLISRKIELFGNDNIGSGNKDNGQTSTKSKINSQQLAIQISIRRACIQYLRNNLLGLPELPDKDRFEELKKQYEKLIKKRIQIEKQMALLDQKKFRQIRDSQSSNVIFGDNKESLALQVSSTKISNEAWQNISEEEMATILKESDPMLQQILIIQSYIRQARKDNRYEVKMLEEHLKELEIEYYFLKQQL